MTNNEKKNQSTEIDSEMTWMKDLVDKSVKTANNLRICLFEPEHIKNMLHMFQKVKESMSMIKKEKI